MPQSWQRALYIPLIVLAWVAIILIGGWLLSHVVKTLLTLLLSGIVAFALTPLVSLLTRWLPRGLAAARPGHRRGLRPGLRGAARPDRVPRRHRGHMVARRFSACAAATAVIP